jgi:hypothetical protein
LIEHIYIVSDIPGYKFAEMPIEILPMQSEAAILVGEGVVYDNMKRRIYQSDVNIHLITPALLCHTRCSLLHGRSYFGNLERIHDHASINILPEIELRGRIPSNCASR